MQKKYFFYLQKEFGTGFAIVGSERVSLIKASDKIEIVCYTLLVKEAVVRRPLLVFWGIATR